MTRQAWILTDERIAQLNAYADQGLGLSAAATEMGVHHLTIRRAVQRQGLQAWLRETFPGQRGKGGAQKKGCLEAMGPRHLKPEQIRQPLDIDWSNRHVRAAAMCWRGAA